MPLTTSPVAEDHIQVYRQVLMTVHKKISDCLQGGGKGTDGQSIERRLKKTLDFSLGQSLSEQGRLLGQGQIFFHLRDKNSRKDISLHDQNHEGYKKF